MSNSAKDHDSALREHLVELLRGEHAHVSFAASIRDVPPPLRGAKPQGVEHSLWELLEHLRLAQFDILEFSRNPSHESPAWPAGYWPAGGAEPPSEAAWDDAVAAFDRDLLAMERLVADPASDLFAPFPHGKGQTLLREALLAADHNAYHVGQIVALRRLLGDWPPARR
ncbi:MAG TPA: DinB family protein [Thermoanaerobaculia bacterium]|nr:DinB family protein [Thermoanaerobaculia bacterium]